MGEEVFFSRWTRKGYAVFNSLKKEIRIGMLDIQLHFQSPQIIIEGRIARTLLMTDEETDYQAISSESTPDFNSILVFNEVIVNKTPKLGPLNHNFVIFQYNKALNIDINI
ncbi:hypothetical protein [Flammeovirga sp. EKP202]|uniref:hypothetical protein n=1 Tax=Flammeovirga sp. EKP202 TaxID=2770592 RepID=UPI00165FC107|nr:hypothetical protein [Flammeovirga sp. EKP202]MBD0404447.1 hypothetical protein [Flammeovirga sp. EKP202]